MKKFLSAFLCVLLMGVFCVGAACTPKRNDNESSRPENLDKLTVIKVQNFPGGIGSKWLNNAAKRFEAQYKEHSFEEGKKGVYIDVYPSAPDSSTLNTSAYHIVFDERYSNVYSLAETNMILDLNDLMTDKSSDGKSIEERINPANLESLKGPDGKYYALPHYEWFPGLTYDKDSFDKNKWYIAKDSSNGKELTNQYGTVYLVKDLSADKSCGPDGVYGTEDDGLPSSLQEMLVLCGQIKKVTGIGPFTMSGAYLYYSNYLAEGLWAALAGSEELRAVYDLQGDVDVVTGFTDEDLFKGVSGIKKPVVTKTTINDSNGRLAFQSAARYYALAFIEALYKEGFFSDEVKGSESHTAAQKSFINGGIDSSMPDRAFLIEGSYWYNESVDADNFSEYYAMTGKETREVRYMSLPTKLEGSATVSSSGVRKQSLIDNGIAYAYINARYKNNTELIEACKEFLKFLYTDSELKEFTALTGVTRPLDYSLSKDQYNGLSSYQQKVYEMSRSSDILYFGSKNQVFKANQSALKIHFSAPIMQPKINNTDYKSCFEALAGNNTARQIFETTNFSEADWNAILGK